MKLILRTIALFIYILCFQSICSFGQKEIYITLDMSGSMVGKKYEYANYGAQVIATLNQNNKVTLIYKKIPTPITGTTLNQIQVPYENVNVPFTEINDIAVFNNLFDEKTSGVELFVIGDGDWVDTRKSIRENIKEELIKNIGTGNLRVTFLEIVKNKNITTSFEKYIKSNDIGKIYKTTNNERSIIDNINIIVEEITGVSSLPKKTLQVDGNCVTFSPELNLEKFIVLYQDDERVVSLPNLLKVQTELEELDFQLLGNPSTESFQTAGGLLSSHIYDINESIHAGTSIQLCFDKPIDSSKLKIFPISKVQFGDFTIETEKGKTNQVDINTTGVCSDNDSFTIQIGFNESSISNTELLKQTQVVIYSEEEQYKAKYKDGFFTATIPLKEETTSYRIESELKGYFRKNSGIRKVIKTTDCIPKEPITETRDMSKLDLGAIDISELLQDDYTIKGNIIDEETGAILDANQFNFKVKNEYPLLFKTIKANAAEDGQFEITFSPLHQFCECYAPNEIELVFQTLPKEAIEGKTYIKRNHPVTLEIQKNKTWLGRCKWLLFVLLSGIFLLWYFIRLMRKARFKKGAVVNLYSPKTTSLRSLRPEYNSVGYKLREPGFIHWINRWFNPFGAEKNTHTFERAGGHSFQYIATKSYNYVNFPKSNFKEEVMDYFNYDPDTKSDFVKFDQNSELVINKNKMGVTGAKYKLDYYVPPKGWNDIASFRFFITLLFILLLLILAGAMYLLFQSIF